MKGRAAVVAGVLLRGKKKIGAGKTGNEGRRDKQKLLLTTHRPRGQVGGFSSLQVNQTFGGGGRVYRWHRRTAAYGAALFGGIDNERSARGQKRDRDTEPDLIRNQNIF